MARLMKKVGTAVATNEGSTRAAEKSVGVKAPFVHTISEVTSPITVNAPPQLAAMTMAEPSHARERASATMRRISISIRMVVVRLSRLADMRKVTPTKLHSSWRLLGVRTQRVMALKQPSALSTLRMFIVARRKRATAPRSAAYRMNTCVAMNCLTSSDVDATGPAQSVNAAPCIFSTNAVPVIMKRIQPTTPANIAMVALLIRVTCSMEMSR